MTWHPPKTRAPGLLRLGLALTAAAAGAGLSAILLLEHHGLPSAGLSEVICDQNAASGCARVADSSWSAVLGLPLAAVGLAFFVSLGALLSFALLGQPPLRRRLGRLAVFMVGAALVVDLFLLGVQAFSIGAFCSLCLWTYAANAAALACLLPMPRAGDSPEAADLERFAVRAWALTTGIVIAAVFVINDAFEARAATDLSILGVASAEEDPPDPPDVPDLHDGAFQPISFPAPVPGGGQWRRPAGRGGPMQDISLEGIPRRGDADAPIQVVTFSDFLCPSCQNFARAYEQFVAQRPEGMHMVLYYKNFPLDSTCAPHLQRVLHPGACEVARGAICAQRLGGFWEYHDEVYAAPPMGPGRGDVVKIAASAGIAEEPFEACMDEDETDALLTADIEEGLRLGVSGTPSIFMNGRRVPTMNDFAAAVEWELENAGVAPPGGPDSELQETSTLSAALAPAGER